MGPFARPKWSSIGGGQAGSARVRRGQATVVVCGDQLDGSMRAALSSSIGTASGEPEMGDAVQVVVIEQLCAHPERLAAFYERHRPLALVAAACSLGAARAALDAAVGAGADTARVVARSLAAALARDAAERTFVVAASFRAWSCRARALSGAPLAGHRPWRSGEPLDRRSLLGVWRGQPSTAARIDPGLCAGAYRCGRCLRDCPNAAIRVSGSGSLPEVDPLECVSCGRCVATCPSHAVSMPGADLDGIAAELDSLLAEGLRDISVACERGGMACDHPSTCATGTGAAGTGAPGTGAPGTGAPGTGAAGTGAPGTGAALSGLAGAIPEAEIFVPCVAMLGPGVRILLSRAGVQADIAACRECPSGGIVDATARFAGRLADALGADSHDTAGEPLRATASALAWYEPAATHTVVTTVATHVSGAKMSGDDGDALGHGGNKGVMLDPGAATFVVRVDGALCSVCGACALACPTAAIVYDSEAQVLEQVLEVDPWRCVGCGRCVTVCPESAVSVERGVGMDAVLTGPSPVAVAPFPQTGPGCSQSGGSVSSDPLVAAVQRRLAARGRPSALLASLSGDAARPPRVRDSDPR